MIEKVVRKISLNDPEDYSYWMQKTPEERIDAVDELREEYFELFHYKLVGLVEPDENGKRLRRVYQIIKRV